MSEEVKQRIAEAKARKRKENPLAKDYELFDWEVACDYVEEHYPELLIQHAGTCFFRWVPKGVEEVVAKRFPHDKVVKRQGPSGLVKEVCVFQYRVVKNILEFLNLDVEKYSNSLK